MDLDNLFPRAVSRRRPRPQTDPFAGIEISNVPDSTREKLLALQTTYRKAIQQQPMDDSKMEQILQRTKEEIQQILQCKSETPTHSPSSASLATVVSPNEQLMMAVENNDTEALVLALERGADVSHTAIQGITPLHKAANRGYVDVVRMLVEARAPVNACDSIHSTPLHCAVQFEHEDTISILLDARANPSIETMNGLNPLHWAAWNCKPKAVNILLQRGCRIDTPSKMGTAVDVAIRNGDPQCVKLLLKHKATPDPTAFRAFAISDSGTPTNVTTMCSVLSNSGLNVNYKFDDKGQTVLHAVAESLNHLSPIVAKCIIDMKANTNIVDNDGNTPLHIAAVEGNRAVLQILLENGADSNITNRNGKTAKSMSTDNEIRTLLS